MAWTVTSDKFLSKEQVSALLEHLERERDLAIARGNFTPLKTYYIIRGLLETGARCFEFCALKNMDLTGHKLVIQRGKGGKARTVLLTKATANCLKEWISVKEQMGIALAPDAPLFPARHHSHYSPRGLRKLVKAAFFGAGLPDHLSVHALRHTNISLLLAAKVPLPRVRDNAGHSSIQITDLYSHAVGDLDCEDLLEGTSTDLKRKAELQEQHKPPGPINLLSLARSKRRKRNQK